VRSSQGFGSLWHLVGRFLGSVLPFGPSASAEGWATTHLLPAEIGLFETMSGPDRRHAIGVAHRAIRLLDDANDVPDHLPTREFIAAALLHDIGKTKARLGTIGRVAATVAAVALGREKVVAWVAPRAGAATARRAGGDRLQRRSPWSPREWQARMGLYLMHDSIGAGLLQEVGSDLLTVTWAREHHLPESRWSVEPNLGHALKEADGD
jgi:hypothetical protein